MRARPVGGSRIRPFRRETILRVLDAARFAPSGGNRQGWRVVVVEDPERRRALRDLYLPTWRAYTEQTGAAQMLARPEDFDERRVRMVKRADGYAEHLDEVPMHLLIGVRLEDLAVTDAALRRQSIVGGASIYPFVQNLLLALRAEGLAAAMTTLLVPAEADVRRCSGSPRRSPWRPMSGWASRPLHGPRNWPANRSRSSPSPSAGASPC